MSRKSGKIAELLESYRGCELDAHYLGYFACFNRGRFFEAHDVLEELWLPARRGPNGDFYKGLIQLAGAFVHLEKNRLLPSAALFRLARTNLQKYPVRHEHFDVTAALALIANWLGWLEKPDRSVSPARALPMPEME
jgi:predicted metal-dependent hydrolase